MGLVQGEEQDSFNTHSHTFTHSFNNAAPPRTCNGWGPCTACFPGCWLVQWNRGRSLGNRDPCLCGAYMPGRRRALNKKQDFGQVPRCPKSCDMLMVRAGPRDQECQGRVWGVGFTRRCALFTKTRSACRPWTPAGYLGLRIPGGSRPMGRSSTHGRLERVRR